MVVTDVALSYDIVQAYNVYSREWHNHRDTFLKVLKNCGICMFLLERDASCTYYIFCHTIFFCMNPVNICLYER